MAISPATLCMQVTLTVPFLLTVLGSIVGQAKVIMLPESKKALMGCFSSWMLGRLWSRVEWTTQHVSQGLLAGPRVVDSGTVGMGSFWGVECVGLLAGCCCHLVSLYAGAQGGCQKS